MLARGVDSDLPCQKNNFHFSGSHEYARQKTPEERLLQKPAINQMNHLSRQRNNSVRGLVEWIRGKIYGFRALMVFDNWPSLLLQRLFLRESPAFYRKGRVIFLADHKGQDQGELRECFTTDMYSRFFSLFPPNPLTILDLGANSGGFGVALSAEGFRIRRIVAVEITPRAFARLAFNLGYNFGCTATALNCGVCGCEGPIRVRDNLGWAGNSIYEKDDGSDDFVTVPGVTFDQLYRDYFKNDKIDIAKIDIELAEYEILYSDTCRNLTQCEFVLIEIHPHPSLSTTTLIERIKKFGFELIADGSPDCAWIYLFRKSSAARG
jgi:FkbM family methyltransferase